MSCSCSVVATHVASSLLMQRSWCLCSDVASSLRSLCPSQRSPPPRLLPAFAVLGRFHLSPMRFLSTPLRAHLHPPLFRLRSVWGRLRVSSLNISFLMMSAGFVSTAATNAARRQRKGAFMALEIVSKRLQQSVSLLSSPHLRTNPQPGSLLPTAPQAPPCSTARPSPRS